MSHKLATDFMRKVYEKIAHGEPDHRKWLEDMCNQLVPDLVNIMAQSDIRQLNSHYVDTDKQDDVRLVCYNVVDVDNLDDYPE